MRLVYIIITSIIYCNGIILGDHKTIHIKGFLRILFIFSSIYIITRVKIFLVKK